MYTSIITSVSIHELGVH